MGPGLRPADGIVRPVPVDVSGRDGPTRGQAAGPAMAYDEPRPVRPVRRRPRPSPSSGSSRQSMRSDRRGRHRLGCAVACTVPRSSTASRRDGRTMLAVPLACGPLHQIRRAPGDDVIRDILRPDEVRHGPRGVPCTRPCCGPRSTRCGMPRTSARLSVALDMMAAAELTSVRRLQGVRIGDRHGWTGIQRVRDAVALADNAQPARLSETRFRLIWQLDARRPRPLVNRPVFDRSRTTPRLSPTSSTQRPG